MKKLLVFGAAALSLALAACNQPGVDLLEDESADLAFYSLKAATVQGSSVRAATRANSLNGDIPALKVKLRIKNQRNAANQLEKVASATMKWGDEASTLNGTVTLTTHKLNSTTILGTTTAAVSSNKIGDAVVTYTGNIGTAATQIVGTDALCVDAVWSMDTGGVTPDFSFEQVKAVTFCQKQPAPAVADLTVVSGGASVAAAPTVTKPVVFSVRNNGPKTATNIQLLVTVPSGLEYIPPVASTVVPFFICLPDAPIATLITCNAASMGKGSKDIKLNFRASALGSYPLPATVSSSTIDSISGNNSTGAVAFTVTNAPPASTSADVAVNIVPQVAPTPFVGTNYTYNINLTNTGPDASSAARTLTIYRSTGLTFVSSTASGVTCANTGDVTTCTLPALANAASLSIPFIVNPTLTGNIGVTAELGSLTEDSSQSNDVDSVSSVVQ
jgi:Domain of unknown function DUF11